MERVTVAAAADVSTGHEPPESAFTYVLDILRHADIRFAQVERTYSERGSYQEQAGSRHARQDPRQATAFKSVPFDVLSIASNHTGDWGPDPVEDTAELFKKLGIATVGAGKNITEARMLILEVFKRASIYQSRQAMQAPLPLQGEGREGDEFDSADPSPP